jgi:hypothetical protein
VKGCGGTEVPWRRAAVVVRLLWARERRGKRETEWMEGETGCGPGRVKAGRRCRAACVAWHGRDDARGHERGHEQAGPASAVGREGRTAPRKGFFLK